MNKNELGNANQRTTVGAEKESLQSVASCLFSRTLLHSLRVPSDIIVSTVRGHLASPTMQAKAGH